MLERVIPAYIKSGVQRVIVLSPTAEYQASFKQLLDSDYVSEKDYYTEFTNDIIDEIQDSITRLRDIKTLIVIDDHSTARALNLGRKGSFARLVTVLRHLGGSLCVIGHSLLQVSGSMRDGADHIVLFKSTREQEILDVGAQWSSHADRQLFVRMYRMLFPEDSPPFSYLHIAIEKGSRIHYFANGTEKITAQKIK